MSQKTCQHGHRVVVGGEAGGGLGGVVVCFACTRRRLAHDRTSEGEPAPRFEPRSSLSPVARNHRERMLAHLARP